MPGCGMSTQYQIVFCTCPDSESAVRLSHSLVEQRLAACVSQIPGLTSIYPWQGKIETASEVLLLIKTRADQWERLQTFLNTHHPYELPEIVAVPIVQGSEAYLSWMSAWLDGSSS